MTVKNHSKTCLIISACIMALAVILSLCGLGINYGIDFTGGLSLQYDMGGEFNQADINAALNEMNVGSYTVTEQGTSEVIVRVKEVSEEGVQGLSCCLRGRAGREVPQHDPVRRRELCGPCGRPDAAVQCLHVRADCQRADAGVHRHPL